MNTQNDFKTEVANLIADVERTHRYSMSRIYQLYNQAYGTSETPQACSSCLIRKVRRLKEWLAEQPTEQPADTIAGLVSEVKVVKRKSKKGI